MRDCDKDPLPSLNATKAREAEQASMINKSTGYIPGCEAAREMTAHELLCELEYRTNQHWLDLQALRRALPQELSPAANRALSRLVRASVQGSSL